MFGQRRVVPEEKKVELRNYQVHVHNIVLRYTTIKNWSNCKTGVKQGDHMYRALFSVFGTRKHNLGLEVELINTL